jgi:DNA-binding transcriptional ArsR family regulator
MKTLQQKMRGLPAARRRKIDARTAQLVREEMTLRKLREAYGMTQVNMAKSLKVNQEQVSRIEARTDLHISTLRRHVRALGGDLKLVATFPEGATVEIAGLGELQV